MIFIIEIYTAVSNSSVNPFNATDVYIRPKNVIQRPRMCIYILKSRLRWHARVYTSSQKLIFVLPGHSRVFTVVAERSFFLPLDHSRMTGLKGKTAFVRTYIYVHSSWGIYIENMYIILRSFRQNVLGIHRVETWGWKSSENIQISYFQLD